VNAYGAGLAASLFASILWRARRPAAPRGGMRVSMCTGGVFYPASVDELEFIVSVAADLARLDETPEHAR